MYSFLVENNVAGDDDNDFKGNLLLNDKFLVSIDKPLLPTNGKKSEEKYIKTGFFLYNMCITLICCTLDIILIYVSVKHKEWCLTLPYAVIELLITFSSLGIIICSLDIIFAFYAMTRLRKLALFIYYLSLLKICLSTARNILLLLVIIPVYYIRTRSNVKYCNELYHWCRGIIFIQLLFYILSIIIKAGIKIFGRYNTMR